LLSTFFEGGSYVGVESSKTLVARLAGTCCRIVELQQKYCEVLVCLKQKRIKAQGGE